METLVVPDPFERNEYYHSDPNSDRDPSTDRDPSGEVDQVEVVTLGGQSEGQGHNVDLSTSQGQGHSNQVTSEWTTSPNNVDFDLESDLEDEGLELFEDDDFRSVHADETFDIDDDDEELIRGMLKFHF